ncbi:glycosyltransferase [Marinobacter sp. DUT-1]|uniref:glycosyltransferase n=1 Tax=Marinobacter sp. DUT-1 TaxID=3412037 RepID=UPI003D1810BB
MHREIIWVTWENHRRSIVLAEELGAHYCFVKSNEIFIFRHLIKAIKTVKIIYKNRKGLIVVQNPSRILAALAAMMKLFFRFPLVVDRHTNFRLGKGITINPAIWFVIICSEFSLKIADLTIVTNDFLKKMVERKGGRSLVLHDKVPEIKPPHKKPNLPAGFNILFVCTYAPDEPYNEVINAAKHLPNDFHIHITGNYEKAGIKAASSQIPANVHLLGFVPIEDYEAYLFYCDIVMVLTSSEWVILCGGYEAAAVRKPLITSKTQALYEFFQSNAFYTGHAPESIAEAIKEVSSNIRTYQDRIHLFLEVETKIWERQWFHFKEAVDAL